MFKTSKHLQTLVQVRGYCLLKMDGCEASRRGNSWEAVVGFEGVYLFMGFNGNVMGMLRGYHGDTMNIY